MAILGTGKIPRYTVLVDENDFTLDTIENFTYAMAYGHQVLLRGCSHAGAVNLTHSFHLTHRPHPL